MFQAAFENYARQQGFYEMLGEEGAAEPQENAARWRQKMAQATTALTAGWVSMKILGLHRLSNTDNAHALYRRLLRSYSNVTDRRQISLRDEVDRCVQQPDESLDRLAI